MLKRKFSNIAFIDANMLKVVAIIAVIIDHIGVYFQSMIDINTYIAFRIIGRIAMPLFAYMLVQGFFHTSNLNKYIKRLFISGAITQIVLLLLYTINNIFFKSYKVADSILNVNIIISFAVCLIILKCIDEIVKCIDSKTKLSKDLIALIIASIILVITYFLIQYDYSFKVPVYVLMIYVTEKLYIAKKINKPMYNFIQLFALIFISFISLNKVQWFSIFSYIFILLYNGRKNKKSKLLTTVFYAYYPIQHFIIYFIAMLMYKI